MSNAQQPQVSASRVPVAEQWLPGLYPPAEPGPLLDWVERSYVPLKKAMGGRVKSGVSTQCDMQLFEKFCLETLGRRAGFDDLTLLRANQFFLWHEARPRVHSKGTPNRSRRTLGAVWREAAKQNLAPPPCDLPQARVDKKKPRAWSVEEVGRIAYTARSAKWHWYRPRGRNLAASWSPPSVEAGLWFFAIVMTAYYTGARITAILTTPAKLLDLDAARLTIPADVQKHRVEQDYDLASEVIAAWRSLDPHRRALVRLGDDWPYDRGAGGNWQTLCNWLKRLLRESGVGMEGQTDFRRELWHKFRRTCATHLAASEGIEKARIWLGHSSQAMTMRYIDDRFLPRIDVARALPRPPQPPSDILPLRLVAED